MGGISPCCSTLSAVMPLPPRASPSISIMLRAPWAAPGFTDGQRPSPQRRAVEVRNGRPGLGGVGHVDKAKAPRQARVPIGHHADAHDLAIGVKELRQLFF